MPADWYYAAGGQRSGPVDAAELRRLFQAGRLSPADLVWREGMAKWAALWTVADVLDGQPVPPPLPVSSADCVEPRGAVPRIYYRKLWSPALVDRWSRREFTSVHDLGEPPEWSERRNSVGAALDDYPLSTHYGKGMALPSAREKYYSTCVQRFLKWDSVAKSEQMEMGEQAGVFAFACASQVYWYADESRESDVFAVFYGVAVCSGPEPESFLVAVIKPITTLPRKVFVDQYCGGNAPQQPPRARDEQIIDHNPRLEGLSWEDEVES